MLTRDKLAELRSGNADAADFVDNAEDILDTLEKLFAVYEAAEDFMKCGSGKPLTKALAELRGTK